jgi:CRISPR-associated protein Cmr2
MGPASHNALSRALLDFSNQLVPYLTEVRHAGRLIYGGGDDVLAYTNLWEWDSWLWDIRQCFKGGNDPQGEFAHDGDYWRWQGETLPKNLSSRPLFTMGSRASISFGMVLAHHSVPLAIALENLWAAEDGAKDHRSPQGQVKDAVQVRVLYGNGNILKATAKFEVFAQWRSLLDFPALDSALFEQAAEVWSQHPVPCAEAIIPWTRAFCSRREVFKGDDTLKVDFQKTLSEFLTMLYETTQTQHQETEVKNWLKLAAFVLRSRQIKVGGER